MTWKYEQVKEECGLCARCKHMFLFVDKYELPCELDAPRVVFDHCGAVEECEQFEAR